MSRFFKQLIFISLNGAIKKSLFAERLFGMDPAGFAPASLRVKGNMLLNAPRARIHDFIITKKALFAKDLFC